MKRVLLCAAALVGGCAPTERGGVDPVPVVVPDAGRMDADAADAGAQDAALDMAQLAPRPMDQPSEIQSAGRVVAIGDVHGDLRAARTALRLAGAIDEGDRWIGGDLVVVQVGDQLDRGDDERAILDWFEVLADEAWAAGGGFYPLLGNHEVMNVDQDFRYITPGGFEDFADLQLDPEDPFYDALAPEARGRWAAFQPGGPYALLLSGHNIALQVDDTVFVHGGLLPTVTRRGSLEALNTAVRAWMRDEGPYPAVLTDDDSPIWSRHFSDETDAMDCDLLAQTLADLGAARMVVAHTVQRQGINAACDGQVWRVDVGLATYYGGSPQVLEITDLGERVID